MRHQRQVLLIDADDTLWENNLNYERAIAAFLELLAPLGYAEAFVRQEVDLTERAHIPRRGYGASNFLLSLEEVYLRLAGHRAQKSQREEIRGFIRYLLVEPPQLYEDVAETLAYLAPRHCLLLFSKGDAEEQRRKLAASGVESFFEAREIVPEKDEAAYRSLVLRHRLLPEAVWMVGNSPRSDINPALAAGLNAVFIPAPHNWEYENEEIRGGAGRLLVLRAFRELQEHF